jgi:hypothetical protein
MSFSALDRYYVKLFEVNLDFLFFIVKKRLNNMARQHTIPWNKVRAVPSMFTTVNLDILFILFSYFNLVENKISSRYRFRSP